VLYLRQLLECIFKECVVLIETTIRYISKECVVILGVLDF
jgi:hypothetical protein